MRGPRDQHVLEAQREVAFGARGGVARHERLVVGVHRMPHLVRTARVQDLLACELGLEPLRRARDRRLDRGIEREVRDLERRAGLLRVLLDIAVVGLDLGPDRVRNRASGGGNERRPDEHRHVAARELAQPIPGARRHGVHRLTCEIAPDVGAECRRRVVAPRTVLLERAHHDPIEFAAQDATAHRRDPRRRPRRHVLADRAEQLGVALLQRAVDVERLGPRQQLVEQHAERVDVGARVDVEPGLLGLLGRHVVGRADHLLIAREQRLLRELRVGRLRDAEVDDRRLGLAVVQRDEHVGRLDVTMDDALVMRVLDRVAHLGEQPQAIGDGELVPLAVVRDRHAAHELHCEERAAARGRAAVEHLRDVRVVHERERLALGLEAGNDLLGVHAQLDDLERDLALHRLGLDGLPHRPHAALADLLQQFVAPDHVTGTFAGGLLCGVVDVGHRG